MQIWCFWHQGQEVNLWELVGSGMELSTCVWLSDVWQLEGEERTVHENETRKSARLGQVFPGYLILESSGMPLSLSCTWSHSKTVPTPSSPAVVWFSLLAVTVGSRRKVPRVYMHGFPYTPTIQTKNGKENNKLWLWDWKSQHNETKQIGEIPGKQGAISQPKMEARDSCHL